MSDEPTTDLIERSGYRRVGFAAHYDAYRPAPPSALLDLLERAARAERPRLVVDLGSGTGLSTRAWGERAERVVGVEPNALMRSRAEEGTATPNVGYVGALAHTTGLTDGCADIVTCSQSLHWMEPEPTFAEVARILRPGGVFAAYDYDLPPFLDADVDAAFERYLARRREVRAEHGIPAGASRWPKHEHLERMRTSGHFRRCRELVLHAEAEWDTGRIVGLAHSIGPLPEGVEPGIGELRAVAERVLHGRAVRGWLGYRVRLGLK